MNEKDTVTDSESPTDSLPSMADEFDDELPQAEPPGGDPDSSEFRDSLNTLPNRLGVQTLLDQELDLQEQERERATLDALEAMRALDHGETVKWRITRTGCDDDMYNGYLETWFNSQMTIERIKKKLGGGVYYLKGFRNGKYFTHKTVVVAGMPLLKPGETSTQPSTPDRSFDVQGFLAQQNADERQRRREQDERDERRRKERLELIMALGPVVAPIVAAMIGNRGPDLGALVAALKPPPPPDPVQQIVALKALIEPVAPPPSALDSAFGVIEKLKDLGALGVSDQGTGWMDILKETVKFAGPGLAGAVETVVQNAQVAAAERARALRQNESAGSVTIVNDAASSDAASQPDTGALPAPSTHTGGPMLGLLKHIPFFKGQIQRWITAAEKSYPVQMCAAMFFLDAPKDLEPEPVAELLSRADWLEQLCRFDPRCRDHREWFVQLHAELLNILRTEYLNTNAPAAGAARTSTPKEIERPLGLPSLTGDR